MDKIQTGNLRVKNPNSLYKIQHYGNTAYCIDHYRIRDSVGLGQDIDYG